MPRTFIFSLLISSTVFGQGQSYRFDDPNLVFVDTAGNQLTTDEITSLFVRYSVSLKEKESPGGKRTIMLLTKPKATSVFNVESGNELVGKEFPPFVLTDVADSAFSESNLNGRLTVFNFWFIGCKPCIAEMPDLNKLVEKYEGMGVSFLAPSLDDRGHARRFLKKHDFKYRVLHSAGQLAKDLNFRSYPTHVVVLPNGKILDVFSGASAGNIERLDRRIEEGLSKSRRR